MLSALRPTTLRSCWSPRPLHAFTTPAECGAGRCASRADTRRLPCSLPFSVLFALLFGLFLHSFSSAPCFAATSSPSALAASVLVMTPLTSGTDTTPPVPLNATIKGTTGKLIWTETGSPPVVNVNITSVTSTGAYLTAVNGTYPISSGVDANGNRYFQMGSGEFIYFNVAANLWISGTTLDAYEVAGPDNGLAQYEAGGSASRFPLTGWSSPTDHSSSDWPAFTSVGGTTLFGANQGLTITGLSGGAVTISNVVTSGTTTTFTTSRAIAPTETGGALSGAAGAFTDSASPPNANAAFSAPIVAANINFTGTPMPTGLTATFSTR